MKKNISILFKDGTEVQLPITKISTRGSKTIVFEHPNGLCTMYFAKYIQSIEYLEEV